MAGRVQGKGRIRSSRPEGGDGCKEGQLGGRIRWEGRVVKGFVGVSGNGVIEVSKEGRVIR